MNLLEEKVLELRDQIYLPFIKDFLSKLTVVCFSSSGWDNQLMWAHYANSYSGICVEYDFEKMNEFIGFMYPVEYFKERPTVTLKDFGIDKLETDENGKLITSETNMSAIFSYLLAKNECWKYEAEWRIINLGEQPYTPMLINAPFTKSITMGINLDDMCKQLLWDVCQEIGIDCYQLVINPNDYHLRREKLTKESMPFDGSKELAYIKFLVDHTSLISQKLSDNSRTVVESIEKDSFETSALLNVLTTTVDFLSDAYFLKTSFNRYYKHIDVQEHELNKGEQIATGISGINSFISSVQSGIAPIETGLTKLLLTRKISSTDYYAAKKLVANIKELVDKHYALKWFVDIASISLTE